MPLGMVMGTYGVTPLYGLSFFLWIFMAWVYAAIGGYVVLASLGGILGGLAIGTLHAQFRLRQLDSKGEIKLSSRAVAAAFISAILIVYLFSVLASIPLVLLFIFAKIVFGALAGFWGPTWFFFRRWERRNHKEIVTGGFWSTRIYAIDKPLSA